MYHVSCFMQSSKQATPWKRQSTIWAYSRSYLTTLISMDTLHNIIRYLLPSPSSSKSLENSILVYKRIYSLYMTLNLQKWSDEYYITIPIWGRPILPITSPIPTYVITTHLLLTLFSYSNPTVYYRIPDIG